MSGRNGPCCRLHFRATAASRHKFDYAALSLSALLHPTLTYSRRRRPSSPGPCQKSETNAQRMQIPDATAKKLESDPDKPQKPDADEDVLSSPEVTQHSRRCTFCRRKNAGLLGAGGLSRFLQQLDLNSAETVRPSFTDRDPDSRN